MKILWVNPGFLDYRVPVYAELDRLTGGMLSVLYSKSRTPARVSEKIEGVLGSRAVGLDGELWWRIGRAGDTANASLQVPYQPGLLRHLLEQRPEVVIAEGLFQWTPAAVMKRLVQRTPLVIAYERTCYTERNCPCWRTAYRKAVVSQAGAMLCNGILSKEYALRLGMAAGRIFTGAMASDSEGLRGKVADVSASRRKQIRQAYGLKSPVFLSVGKLIPRKGVFELLAGWQRYKAGASASGSLLLVGDGSQRQELETWVRTRQVPDVAFGGAVDYDTIADYYATANVFVIATLEDNWSLVVPEAMACGLPVACSQYNGCWPELVKPGRNGLVFDPLDPDAVAGCLSYFAERSHDLARMGEESRQIEAGYTPKRAAQAALEACSKALEGSDR